MDNIQQASLIGSTSLLAIGALKKYFSNNNHQQNNSILDEKKMNATLPFEPIRKRSPDIIARTNTILANEKYPAKAHNNKVKSFFYELNKDLSGKKIGVFLSSSILEPIKYCDQTKKFIQEKYFFYLTGCDLPNTFMFYNFQTEKLCLFLPPIIRDDVVWSGMPLSPEEALAKYDVDEVLYSDKIMQYISSGQGNLDLVYTTDLDHAPIEISSKLTPNDPKFFEAMDEARLCKDDYELCLMRKACDITDKCHLAVMSALPIETNEIHMQAEFTYHAIRQGSKNQGYDPICCSGVNCSTLHYVNNDDTMENKHSVLIDAGAEWENYTADVTRCFPIDGKFTKEHREIYEAVLDMQKTAMGLIRPGVNWEDVHLATHRCLIKHFLKLGIFRSEFSAEEIYDRRVTVCFNCTGCGHNLGLNTHDVGGRPNYEDPDPYFRYLRIRRPLKEGMVVTIEPGIYFNPFIIREFLTPYPERVEVVDEKIMEKYLYVGGVRIEDDLVITKGGYENLTCITSDPDKIEQIVRDGINKGRSHYHNIV
ncbi:related to putative Xaa-Pro dipeptidase [Saccharomycodes ludwigii]|uniref:Related to putative Xaa-Pro dipeptidase n=1 Tax=Saccharomycodes ludwigii TaxID=36035 RepID=A0A376B507_9ASCO|nr:related to putative Xaa-Pro dipeptidase [Saccharomycodes ludwigii]